MAKKDKVPVVAIRQIVKMRDDEYHNYSYRAIAEHLKDEFGIEVTPQAIGYLYRKNKDNFSNQVVAEKIKIIFLIKWLLKKQKKKTIF